MGGDFVDPITFACTDRAELFSLSPDRVGPATQ